MVELLQELRAIISPSLEEATIKADWEIADALPPFVWIARVSCRSF